MQENKQKYTVYLLCLFLLLAFLLSALFLAAEAGHRCSGEDCPICICMQLAERVLRQIGGAVLGAALLLFLLPSVRRRCRIPETDRTPMTLVSQKVRLDD